jgi:hypothetical protein
MQMPLIAQAVRTNSERPAIRSLAAQATTLANVQMVGFTLVAPLLVPAIFGPTFAQPWELITVIGTFQASRFIRVWPLTVALAAGRSKTVLLTNIVRLIAYPIALIGVTAWGDVKGLVLGLTIGETLAMVVAVILSNRAVNDPWYAHFDQLAMFIGTAGGLVIMAGARPDDNVLASFGFTLTAAFFALTFWINRSILLGAYIAARRLLRI